MYNTLVIGGIGFQVIIELFNKVDINNISPLEAFDLVRKVKEVVYNGQNWWFNFI